MLKTYFYILSLLGFLVCYSQITIKPIAETNPISLEIKEKQHSFDTALLLPFWEDFSKHGSQLDTLKWSIGPAVNINNTFTINTPSAYVASFDGVDANGRPYSNNSTFNGAGDSLVSQRIRLNTVPGSRRNTVYFSFFYQLMGLGEIPDDTDSLQLQFFARDSTWSIIDLTPEDPTGYALKGGIDNLVFNDDSSLYFEQIIIPISDPKYFHENFQFKFISYSSLAGIYDTWNIDYIYLNQDRSEDGTEYRDRSVSGQPSALFYPFNSIPANQFSSNPDLYNTPQTITLSNLENGAFTITFVHNLINTLTADSITSGIKNDEGEVGFRSVEFGREVSGISPGNLDITGDSVVITSEFYYETGDDFLYELTDVNGNPIYTDIDLRVNDTIRKSHYLTNFYAFDDGSAEFAAGINLLGGKLAVRYWVNEPDTLTALSFYFPSINPSSVGQTIDLAVWSDLDPEIEQRRQSFTIAQSGRDQFTQVDLSTPLIVRDTFYIGYIQFTDNYIGLGLDKNNPAGSENIFYNTDRQWTQNNRIEGSLMIRPVFESGSEYILSTPPVSVKDELIIFPNPTNGYFSIKGDFDYFEIYGISGRKIRQFQNSPSGYDLSNLNEGFYIINIFTEKNVIHKKLIIRK